MTQIAFLAFCYRILTVTTGLKVSFSASIFSLLNSAWYWDASCLVGSSPSSDCYRAAHIDPVASQLTTQAFCPGLHKNGSTHDPLFLFARRLRTCFSCLWPTSWCHGHKMIKAHFLQPRVFPAHLVDRFGTLVWQLSISTRWFGHTTCFSSESQREQVVAGWRTESRNIVGLRKQTSRADWKARL